jgi:DNA topoisomerase III
MGKSLIIAEKPSVAQDISRALGGFDKKDDYFENDQYVVASAVGHLLELTIPPESEVKRGKWTFAQLPVIPNHFALKPISKTESRLKLLKRLIKRKDVDGVINGCDAGREGELIFRHIITESKTKKPIQRLWLQSMTAQSIRDGFQKLRSDEAMLPLASAAVCRSESDWLVGINGTRAMTAFNSKSGGFFLTTVGRVQTPTLTILVDREQKIKKFVERDYWELHATFQAKAGDYAGRWFDEAFRKKDKEGDPDHRPERIWTKELAEEIHKKCLHQPGTVTEDTRPSKQLSPLLYDLTSLQREANSRFGLPAGRTLQLAQALYERHKMLTYPRTDSRALPEDYIGTVKETLKAFNGSSYASSASKIAANNWVGPNKRIFNNAKISDHFAIIPTSLGPKKKLSDDEQKIYDMVVRRFLAVFFPPAEYLITTRITRVMEEAFKTDGKVLVNPGWLEVYGKALPTGEADNLTPVKNGETVATQEIELKENKTKHPPRYSEATLLSAMEGAGKLVDDEELREAMSAKGLGTPATRASIIENLIREKYVIRNQRELQPTAKAFSLITLLRGLQIPELCSPELTGDWEHKLKLMEQGQLDRDSFMAEIQEMTRKIVEQAKSFDSDTVPGDFGVLTTPCPKCGGKVKETYKTYQCSDCDFSVWKILSGRQFEPEEMETIISKGSVGPLQGFRSKQGWPFAAIIKLGEEHKLEFDFGDNDKDKENDEEEIDFSGNESLGTCPKCKANVYEHGMHFICEKSKGPNKSCDFKTGKIILQREIEPAQVRKLLNDGKTDLINKFISNRTGRAFNAFLVIKDGKVSFEFEPRQSKKKSAKKSSGEPAKKISFEGQQSLGKCPRCEGNVFASESDYLCEHSQKDTKPCKFKSGKVVLQQPVEEEQIKKLLSSGRTDFLKEFISKRGFPFEAALVIEEKGKVGFEFAPRDEGTDESSSETTS